MCHYMLTKSYLGLQFIVLLAILVYVSFPKFVCMWLRLLTYFYQGHCLSMVQAASEVQEQGAVDDRDTFLHGVRDLLSIHSSKQILALTL